MVNSLNPRSAPPFSLSGWKVIGLFVVALVLGIFYFCYTQVELWSVEKEIGLALFDKKDYQNARNCFQAAIREAKKSQAPDYEVGDLLGNLGETHEQLKDYKQAEASYLQGLNLLQQHSQTNNALLSYYLSRLGELYTWLHRPKEAEPYLKQAFAIDQRSLATDDIELADDMADLGDVYSQLGQLSETEFYSKGALAIYEKILKPDDPLLAGEFASLGLLYWRMGRIQDAESALARAQSINPKELNLQGYRELIYLRKRAEKGSAVDQNALGVMYERGNNVPKDNLEAIKWYTRSAEQGNPYAQCNLAMMYEFGRGIPKDEYKAVQWFQKSAKQGYPEGQVMLALMHSQERGGLRKDPAVEFDLYLAAAKQGHHQAEYLTGLYYEEGYGVTKNLKEAKKWLSLAAAGGIKDAVQWRDAVSMRLNQMEPPH